MMERWAFWDDRAVTDRFLAELTASQDTGNDKKVGCRRGAELATKYPPIGKAPGGMYWTRDSGKIITCRTRAAAKHLSLPASEVVILPDDLPMSDTVEAEAVWPELFRRFVEQEAPCCP
jgi:hypothetical protein